MFEWISTLQNAIGRALHSERATPEEIEAAALANSAATSVNKFYNILYTDYKIKL